MCRLAYELMQTHHTDASGLAYSLDDVYYYGGQQDHYLSAFHSYAGTQQTQQGYINLRKGDLVKINGNLKNGFSVGQYGKRRGLFPSYIMEEEILIADFPTYPEVV